MSFLVVFVSRLYIIYYKSNSVAIVGAILLAAELGLKIVSGIEIPHP